MFKDTPFDCCPLWAKLPFMEGLVAETAEEVFQHFTHNAIQLTCTRLSPPYTFWSPRRQEASDHTLPPKGLQPMPEQGMRVYFYLDSLIIMARLERWVIFYTALLILYLNDLGFAFNREKSSPWPGGGVSGDCAQLPASRP